MSRRLNRYLHNIEGVLHTTLNPYRSNALRLHLVPPASLKPGVPWALILNGQDILPLNTSWAVLLAELIQSANRRAGQALQGEALNAMLSEALDNVLKVYPKVPRRMLRDDLSELLNTVTAIGQGKKPRTDTGYMTLAQYAPYMRAPHRMDLMVSAMRRDGLWHCNQKCLHCYAANQPMGERPELSTGDWKRIIDRCREAWIPQLTFTGGEPTMRDDLPELVAHASWFVTRLNTNGIRLTAELCRQLAEASLDSVQITLYSDKPEVHNALVGANEFRNTVEGIKNAVAAGLNVSINTPLCDKNCDYVLTLRFAQALGVKYFSCSALIPTGGAAQEASRETRLSRDQLEALLQSASVYCRQNALGLSFTSPGQLPSELLTRMGLTTPACGACLSNMAVAPDGSVVPCQSWLSEGALGNMLTDSWKHIWKSKACAEIRSRSGRESRGCLLGAKEEDA